MLNPTASPFKVNLLEEEMLRFWKSHHIFQKAVQPADAPAYLLLEQPPAACVRPGLAEARPFLLADAVARYQRMHGRDIRRRMGWQAHGLRVETQAERRLGLASSQQVEAYGQARFNEACHKVAFSYTLEWERFLERSGCWLHGEEAFSTLDDEYTLAVWGMVKTLLERDLLYPQERMALACGRCGTPLSEWEIALGIRQVEQSAAYVRMPLVEDPSTSLLVYSPFPWMLPANTAVAAGPDETFVIVEHDLPEGGKEKLILAQARVEAVFGAEPVRVYESFKGQRLKGLRYRPLFTFFLPEKPAYFVVLDEESGAAQGSGLLALAPACEPHDSQVAKAHELPVFEILAADGAFRSEIWSWRGLHFQAAEPLIVQDLQERGLLYRLETTTQPAPYCRYCDTPLHYRTGRGWYVRTAGRPNETAGFESTLPAAGDWLVSRERGWGAPLPIWECGGCAARQVPASLDELAQWAGHPLPAFDLHALALDRLQLACPACGGRLQRAAGVLDEWFELGALPFFLGVAPPADLVCAGGEAGRLWLAALGTLSTLIAGQDGSRQVLFSAAPASVGEPAPDLLETLRKDGADALRWSVYTAQRAAEAGDAGAAWAGETVLQGLREVQAWLLAAEAAKPSATRPPAPETPPSPLDRWLNSRLQALAEAMTAAMERGEVSGAAEALGRFVTEDLGGWYLRLVRPSIGTPPPALRTALAALSALLAPFAPFLAENLFQKLVRFEAIDAPASIMLAGWPTSIAGRDLALEADMAQLRQLAALGQQARAAANLQPGQPLALARLAAPGRERLVNEYSELLKAALNVQALQVIEGLSSEAPPEWSTAVQDEAAVALDARLTPALERQGLVGELARRVQDFRRRSEFEPAERIRIFLSATPRLAEAVEEHRERLLAETLCDDLQRFDDTTLQPAAEREKRLFTIAEFGGERVTFGIEKLAGPAEQKKAPS